MGPRSGPDRRDLAGARACRAEPGSCEVSRGRFGGAGYGSRSAGAGREAVARRRPRCRAGGCQTGGGALTRAADSRVATRPAAAWVVESRLPDNTLTLSEASATRDARRETGLALPRLLRGRRGCAEPH